MAAHGEEHVLIDVHRQGEPWEVQVRAWHNIPIPEERLRFWTDPKVEIELARQAGSTVFRMGVDWGRIVPEEPLNGISEVVCANLHLYLFPHL